MDTGKEIAVVGHSLGGGVAVLLMIKLFGEELGLLKDPDVSDVPLGAFHDLFVHPSRRRGDAQLPQHSREDGFGLQAG